MTRGIWALSKLLAVAVLLMGVPGCRTDSRDHAMATSQSQIALRQIQSRSFETSDRRRMLRTIIATLQDLSFVIDEADAQLGSVSGTKLDGYQMRITVTVRPRGNRQLLVRASAQFNDTAIDDPIPYQRFFAALEKSLFLTAQKVD